ncbi:MAG TPA: hypothetical protein P5056_04145, partial [Candidatus Paceibacterota bacterium]|nr:hypothetical protein [Candidatus Paceibacterota bacterium]
ILAIGFMALAMSYVICQRRRMVRSNLLFGMTALGVVVIFLLITYGAAKNSREVINVLDMLVDDAKNGR